MSKDTKKCPACGQQVPDKMRYCGWCGFDTRQQLPAEEEMLPRPVRIPKAPRPVETSRWVDPAPEENERVEDEPRSIWRIVLVLCVIAAIIAAAVILVIRMNRPVEQKATSEEFQAVHVITTDGEEVGSTTAPTTTIETAQPDATPEADAAVTEAPETTAPPAATDAPEEPAEEDDYEVTDADDTVYVTGSSVYLRSGPGTDYDAIGSVTAGTELKRTGTTDGWSRVSYNGHTCFISSALVSTEKPAPTATPDPSSYTVTTADDKIRVKSAANLRSGPGTGYEIVGSAEVGTELKRTGTSDGWSRVVVNGQEVFINDGLITVLADGDGGEGASSTGTLTVTAGVNIRSGPGQEYSILGQAKVGDKLDLVDGSGSWYKIDYNGQTAYVYSSYVTKD